MRDVRRAPGTGSTVDAGAGGSTAPGKTTLVQRTADVKGGADNPDPQSFNPHPGIGYGPDPSRLAGPHGRRYKTTRATPLYQLDGTAEMQGSATQTAVMIPAGTPCEINAGAITKLVLRAPGQAAKDPDRHAHAEECVFIFNADGHGGWMPTSALPPIVRREQAGEAKALERERGDAHHEFGHGVEILKGITAQTEGVEELYTYPHQTSVQNKAKYYYGNLSLNLPYTGGNRVGVLTTNIPNGGPAAPEVHGLDPYREFHPREPAQIESIPLYHRGSNRPSGRSLTFVYGYVETDSGSRVYGWINRSMLPHDFDKRRK